MNTHQTQSSVGSTDGSASEWLREIDDMLAQIHNTVRYLSFADQNQTLRASPEKIATEMQAIDTALDKVRVRLFQADKSPVLAACIMSLLSHERVLGMGGCVQNATAPIVSALSLPNK